MADSKISGLPSVTVGATDEFAVVQSGVTSKDTVQGILDLVPASSNLGSSDLTSTANNRIFTLNGNTSSNLLTVEKADGTDLMIFKGDGRVAVPNGSLFLGTTGVGGGHKLYIINSSASTNSINILQSGTNGSGVYVSNTASSAGSAYCFRAVSTATAAGVTKIGFQTDISGGSSNFALDVLGGDFRFDTTTGTMIGTATNEKIGFWNTTPIVQPTALTAADATATDGTIGTNDTITNNLRTRLDELEARLSTAGGGIGLIA